MYIDDRLRPRVVLVTVAPSITHLFGPRPKVPGDEPHAARLEEEVLFFGVRLVELNHLVHHDHQRTIIEGLIHEPQEWLEGVRFDRLEERSVAALEPPLEAHERVLHALVPDVRERICVAQSEAQRAPIGQERGVGEETPKDAPDLRRALVQRVQHRQTRGWCDARRARPVEVVRDRHAMATEHAHDFVLNIAEERDVGDALGIGGQGRQHLRSVERPFLAFVAQD